MLPRLLVLIHSLWCRNCQGNGDRGRGLCDLSCCRPLLIDLFDFCVDRAQYTPRDIFRVPRASKLIQRDLCLFIALKL